MVTTHPETKKAGPSGLVCVFATGACRVAQAMHLRPSGYELDEASLVVAVGFEIFLDSLWMWVFAGQDCHRGERRSLYPARH